MVRYLYRELNTADSYNDWGEELELFSEMIESKSWRFFRKLKPIRNWLNYQNEETDTTSFYTKMR